MTDVYEATVKDEKRRAKKNFESLQKSYIALSDHSTEYSKDVLAILVVKSKINNLWQEMPDIREP